MVYAVASQIFRDLNRYCTVCVQVLQAVANPCELDRNSIISL